MPAVAALGAVIAALLALLLIYGANYLGKFVARLFPEHIGIPNGPGIPIRGAIESLIDTVTSGALAIFGIYIRPVLGFILRPVTSFLAWLTSHFVFITTVASTIHWLVTSALPRVLHVAQALAETALAEAKAYAHGLYAKARQYAHDLVHAARVFAVDLYHRALTYAHDLAHQVKVYAHDLVRAEEVARVAAVAAAKVYAHDLYNVAHTEIGTARKALESEIKAITAVSLPDVSKAIAVGVQQAEDYASAAVAAGIGDLTTDVTATIEGLFDGLIIDVGELADVIGTDLPDIGDLVRAIPRSVPLDIAGSIGLTLTLERVMARYLTRCGIPNCRNLGGLGHMLGDLLGAASLAGLLAMLTEMIADPEAAAEFARDELGELVEDAKGLATSLLGV